MLHLYLSIANLKKPLFGTLDTKFCLAGVPLRLLKGDAIILSIAYLVYSESLIL